MRSWIYMNSLTDWYLHRRNLRKANGYNFSEPSLKFVFSNGSSAMNDSIMIETWLLDVFSNWKTEIMPSVDWVERNFRKHRKREDVWHFLAGLKPLWRDAILQFLKARNDGSAVEWSLYLIELPHQNSRMGLRGFRGHRYDDQLVRVVLFKRKDSFDASNDSQGGSKYANNAQLHDAPSKARPINSYFNESLTNAQGHPPEHQSGGLPRPKVSFADKVDEKTDNKNIVSAVDEPLRFSTEEEVQNAIIRLGAKKKKIGDTDQERVNEINDMIVLLAAQLELHDTLSPSQRKILYGKSAYDQTSEADMKPYANTHLRNPEMNPGAVYHNQSAVTDRTEEIFVPRDHRNRPIGKDGTMSRVSQPELERYRERRNYFDEEDPDVVHDSRRRTYGYADDSIIINNESRTQIPGHARQDYGPFVPGKELVVRHNSPSRLRAFERRRAREPSRHRYFSKDSEHIDTRDRDREWPRYEVDKRRSNSLKPGVEYYVPPDRVEPITIRKDEREREREKYFPREEETYIRERPEYEREVIVIRERRDSSSSADEVMRRRFREKPRHSRRINIQSASPDPGYIQPAVRRTSTFDDGTWPGVENKALVLRTGGSRPTPGYMQEHILDRSIRVRGEQDVLSSPEYPNIKRLRSPNDSRQSSYSERDRVFLPRRSSFDPDWADDERYVHFNAGKPFNAHNGSSHRRPRNRDLERVKNRHLRSRRTISSSEDDEYSTMPDRIASKQQSKQSDEEVITQTLKRFTTFQGDQPPNSNQNLSAVDSLRRHNVAQNRDGTIDLDRQREKGRGLETMPEEPDAMPNGNGPRSPSQAPFYPSTNRFPPPPGPPRPPDSNSESPRNPRAESQRRGYDADVPVPAYRPQGYYNILNSPVSPLPQPELSNNVVMDPTRLSSDEVSPAFESSTKAARNTVAHGQGKPRITELSDGSSEDGRRKLHQKDRKATVEDLEPDLEAGKMDAGLYLYDD